MTKAQTANAKSMVVGSIDTAPRSDCSSRTAWRGLVRTVTVYREDSNKGAVRVEIAGHLNALLASQSP